MNLLLPFVAQRAGEIDACTILFPCTNVSPSKNFCWYLCSPRLLAHPPASGACLSLRPAWFRSLARTQAFGRFDPQGSTCETSITGITLTPADYSLQLAATVTRSVAGSATVKSVYF